MLAPIITFGDDNKGYTMGYCLDFEEENIIIDYVALVDGLKHNLLRISHYVTKGMKFGLQKMLGIDVSVDDNLYLE